MAITFVGSGQDDAANSLTAISPSLPTHQADDFALLFVTSDQEDSYPHDVSAGWTLLWTEFTTVGSDMTTSVWYRRFTGSGTADPTIEGSDQTEEMSAVVVVFRGVDTQYPFVRGPGFAWCRDDNIAEPSEDVVPGALDTFVDGCAGVRAIMVTHDDITTANVPTGYTLAESIIGGAKDFRQQVVAYDLDIGSAGTKTPTTFDLVLNANVGEYQSWFVVLNPLQDVHVTGVTPDRRFEWDETGININGTNFEAVQGTGKVEFWSDEAGTTKVTQTINSWSDTQINIDPVQGALDNDVHIWCVVTNDTGESNAFPFQMIAGFLNYPDTILDLYPDHWWQLDSTFDDDGYVYPKRDMTANTSGADTFSTTEICRDSTVSLEIDGVTERRGATLNFEMNNQLKRARTMAGWIQLGSVQQELVCIYKEGGTNVNHAIFIGFGNKLMVQLNGATDNVQAYSDFQLQPDRPYHVCFRFDYDEGTPEFVLFIYGD